MCTILWLFSKVLPIIVIWKIPKNFTKNLSTDFLIEVFSVCLNVFVAYDTIGDIFGNWTKDCCPCLWKRSPEIKSLTSTRRNVRWSFFGHFWTYFWQYFWKKFWKVLFRNTCDGLLRKFLRLWFLQWLVLVEHWVKFLKKLINPVSGDDAFLMA